MTNFLTTADFLQTELQTFFRVLRRGNNVEAIRNAMDRLRNAIESVEPLAEDPGDAWKDLAPDQRWGYLRVLSHLGTADHELKGVEQRLQTSRLQAL
jgi:hypothetical protein